MNTAGKFHENDTGTKMTKVILQSLKIMFLLTEVKSNKKYDDTIGDYMNLAK